MKGHFRPVIPKVSLHDRRSLIRKSTECRLAAASLQRGADLAKVAGKLGSDALNCSDNRERDARGYEAIFDGGGAGLISPKSANCFHAILVGPMLKAPL